MADTTGTVADTVEARAVQGGRPASAEPGRLGRALTRLPGAGDGGVLSYLEARGQPPEVLETVRGEATFYADYFHLRRTASGEIFDQRKMVAAHRRYPFGTVLRVTNTANDSSVVVRVVDRGPFAPGRRMPAVLDLSRSAAERLDFIPQGRAIVRLEVLEWGDE